VITSVASFAIGDYRLTLDSSLHWAILLFALLGLVVSCVLIFRRFKSDSNTILNKNNAFIIGKSVYVSLLIFGNIIAFISMLIFLLPFEIKVQASTYDVLLTQGFKKSAKNENFNIQGLDSINITQALKSAQRIWLLLDSEESTADNQSLKEWLAKNYSDKVVIINSTQDLTNVWEMIRINQYKGYNNRYKVPTLIQIFGDGLSKVQWQYLKTFNQVNSDVSHTQILETETETDTLQPLKTGAAKKPLIKFKFYASNPITGFSYLHWPKQLILGQALTVTGQFQHSSDINSQFELSLVSNDRIQDSVIVQPNDVFSLTTTSKISGLFNYQLIVKELPNKNTTAKQLFTVSEDIAFSVVMGNQPLVLIKQSAPSFETRRLKQWLSEAGSQVRVISQISKNEWSHQRVNSVQKIKENQSNDLTDVLLENYDLLIIDSRMLLSLPTMEVEAIFNAIKDGLGLLINADSTLLIAENSQFDKLNRLLNLFELASVDANNNQVLAYWPEQPKLAKSDVVSAQSVSININAKQGQTIVESGNGQALVAKQPLGLGSVALTVLNETYQWSSKISPAYYSAYWQYLLLNISRGEQSTRWVMPSLNLYAKVNQHQSICLMSSLENVIVAQLSLTAYPLLNNQQCGQFLASQAGWYSFQALNDQQSILSEQVRYFYDQEAFPAWQQGIKHAVSQFNADANYTDNYADSDAFNSSHVYQQVDKFILWLIMFVSLVLLWLERKWQSS
jgi:hypothetical protein